MTHRRHACARHSESCIASPRLQHLEVQRRSGRRAVNVRAAAAPIACKNASRCLSACAGWLAGIKAVEPKERIIPVPRIDGLGWRAEVRVRSVIIMSHRNVARQHKVVESDCC